MLLRRVMQLEVMVWLAEVRELAWHHQSCSRVLGVGERGLGLADWTCMHKVAEFRISLPHGSLGKPQQGDNAR